MSIEARGVALFSGEEALVRLSRCEGPTTLHTSHGGGPLETWSAVDSFRTTTLAHASGARVACVEHLFAALAAYGAHEGVAIFVEGSELPILDGAASQWCAWLDEMGIENSPSHFVIDRDEEIVVQGSAYRFSKAPSVHVSVEIDFDDPRPLAASLPKRAEWRGEREAFARSIATARTFVFGLDLEELAAQDTFDVHEPVRHKLLDFLGDLFAHGGPPIGRVEASRPGHARNHEALGLALARGILVRR